MRVIEKRQPMNTVEQLENILARIEDPDHWCKGMLYADRDGVQCQPNEYMVRCCLAGAINLVPGDSFLARAMLHKIFDGSSLSEFNDRHTHDEVVGLVKRSIEYARAEEEQP